MLAINILIVRTFLFIMFLIINVFLIANIKSLVENMSN